MGDQADIWRDVAGASQDRRAHNRESSAELLTARGYTFESKNGGAHLIVRNGAKVVDFWPGTGRWRTRTAPVIDKRGVKPLMAWLGPAPTQPTEDSNG